MSKIRILHILHSMNRGGAENAIMNYYRHINHDLIQFDFLLTEPSPCHFEDEIITLGGRIFRVPQLTMYKPWKYCYAVKSFFKTHQEYRIVHSHTSSKSAIPLFIAWRAGVPIRICHSHNTKSENGLRGIIRDILKIPLKSVATHYFSCGKDAALWLYGKKLVSNGRVYILPNVIEAEDFDYNEMKRREIRSSLGINETTIVLGNTARFSPQKNHAFLINLFSDFNKIFPDSRLLLIGDGELKDVVINLVKEYNIYEKTIFTGVVKNVNDYEQAMDFFVMPSFHEGLPLSLIEAQVSGLMCYVSSDVTSESDVTGNVSFIPISAGTKTWCNEIKEALGYNRQSCLEQVRKAGYDAKESSKQLEAFYLNLGI